MDEIFSQVDNWFSPDSIILMRVLISAMDKEHENIHYKNGSIEFLNSRSKYYNLAMILVEGCSRMIQENSEIPETNSQKMLLDLNETLNQIQVRLSELSIADWTNEKQETEKKEMASLTAKFHCFSRNRVCKQSKNIFEDDNMDLEKIWGFEVEKDTILIMIKGFIENLNQRNFDGPNLSEFVEKVIVLRNDFAGLIADETPAPSKPAIPTKLQRTTSEPTPEIRKEGKEKEEDEDSDGSNYVAKMIKNHESIIRRQNRELKRLKGEILGGKVQQAFKKLKGTDDDGMERNLHQVIAHLDEIIAWNAEKMDKDSILIDQNRMKLEQERDDSILTMSIMEEIYQLLLKGLVKDFQHKLEDETRELEEEREDSGIKMFVMDNINKLVLKGLVKDLKTLESINKSSNCIEIEFFIREEIYKVFYREMIKERNLDNFGNVIAEEIYSVIMIEAMKDVYDSKEEPHQFDKWLKNGLMKKVISLVSSLKMGEVLMCRASSEIKEHNTKNEMVAMECDEADERDMIQWLLNSEESTFSSIRDKLEKSLQQLLQCKALLREFLFTLGQIDTQEKLYTFGHTNDEVLSLGAARRLLSLPLTGFKETILEFETVACRRLENNFFRLEELEQQVKSLITITTSLRKKATLYEKAFFIRCQNLRIAEAEVDMLGDQVDMLVGLIGKIYSTLDQHSSVLSRYVPVWDALKMIKKEIDSFAAHREN
ncbi:WPP domain-associated protein-like [Impatiens glandulifera]|uniref:WPP domain-associated protein-like n=1 Tax=Impatiens glandulifera TaxID=253017 RepID=UPI001FB16B40|nr:WPP domain-associated protein-like [Impatiens glandulifera]